MSDARELLLTVPARLTYRDGKGGTLHVRFVDNIASIVVDGAVVGEIASLVGGGVDIEHGGSIYYIDPADLWRAFLSAREADDRAAGVTR